MKQVAIMKKRIEYLALLIIIIISIIAIYQRIKYNGLIEELEDTKDKYTFSQDFYTNIINILKNRNAFQILAEGNTIDNNIYVNNDKDKPVLLRDILGFKPKIVLIYSEINCSTCVEEVLLNLKEVGEKIGVENIIILGSYSNIRDLSVFLRINGVNFPFYNLKFQDLGIFTEKSEFPYIFIYNGRDKAEQVFIPLKEIPELSETYLNSIMKKYFSISD